MTKIHNAKYLKIFINNELLKRFHYEEIDLIKDYR